MRRYILYLLIFFSLFYGIVNAQATDGWQITKSTHFIIYYKDAPEDFIQRLIEKAEDDYHRIADDLGFRRDNFWLWDERAKIYIYDDAKSYQAATGQPSWSSGVAMVKDKTIHTYAFAKGFFNTVLPHEMGHIIFREFVGFDNPAIPLWLDEGVAAHQEKARYAHADRFLRKAIQEGKFLDWEARSTLNPHSIEDKELINLFYLEATSIIGYLIKEFSQDTFISFCQALRDKKNLERALAASYPFKNTAELNRAWQEYLRR